MWHSSATGSNAATRAKNSLPVVTWQLPTAMPTLKLLPIFMLDCPQYFIASRHLTATNCNAYARANIPLLFLTVLCALFVLCLKNWTLTLRAGPSRWPTLQWIGRRCGQRGRRQRGPKIVNFVVQKAAAPKSGVKFRQGSNGTIRSSLFTSNDVFRRPAKSPRHTGGCC